MLGQRRRRWANIMTIHYWAKVSFAGGSLGRGGQLPRITNKIDTRQSTYCYRSGPLSQALTNRSANIGPTPVVVEITPISKSQCFEINVTFNISYYVCRAYA